MTSRNTAARRLRSTLRSRPLAVWATLVLLAAGGVAWNWHLNAAPNLVIPPPAPMPVPNAYDDLLKIASHNVEPSFSIWDTSTPVPTKTTGSSLDIQRRAALAKAEPVLQELRAALAAHHAFREPAWKGYLAIDRAPEAFRSVARTLSFELWMREQAGDYAGAVSSGLDGMELGAVIPNGGRGLERLVGSRVEKIERDRLSELVDRLTAEQAATAAQRMEAIVALRQPLSANLTETKWMKVAELRDSLRNKTTFGAYTDLHISSHDADPGHPGTSKEQHATLHAMFRDWRELMTHSKQQIIDANRDYRDRMIAAAALPFARIDTYAFEPHDPFNREIWGDFSSCYDELLHDDATRIDDGFLTLAFALRAYRVKSGAYPATLEKLVTSGLLRRIPADPFAMTVGAPLRYRRLDANRFLLYSVGPDGIDNGGQPIALRMRANYDLDDAGDGINSMDKDTFSPEPSYVPDARDKGDWVFGVNNVPRANPALVSPGQ